MNPEMDGTNLFDPEQARGCLRIVEDFLMTKGAMGIKTLVSSPWMEVCVQRVFTTRIAGRVYMHGPPYMHRGRELSFQDQYFQNLAKSTKFCENGYTIWLNSLRN